VDVVFTLPSGSDTTPPTVTAVSPPSGASGVGTGTSVRASFSEPMIASTVTAASFELRDAGNAVVAATVSYDGPTRTATLLPVAPLAAASLYTARVRGGTIDPRVKDLAGNALAADVAWSFTTGGASCPCSMWDSTAVPAIADTGDAGALELGVRFRSDVAGSISALRFYKSPANTGPHVGNLWASDGTLLASAVFTSETASGWQEVQFAAPVAIIANTDYVASYHTDSGHYSVTRSQFSSAGVDAAPLHAPVSGANGNGVFRYGASAFPSASYLATNYWVDVVFTLPTGSDTTPPAVVGTNPIAGATGIGAGTTVRATFSEPVQSATVTATTFTLRDAAGALVPATVTYDGPTRTATLVPAAPLSGATTYTALVRGGAADPRVKDLAGNALGADVTWTFTTGAAGCPCSIWDPATAAPFIADAGDASAVELGVKFRSDVSGFIRGLRFYKSAANTGPHVGNLWASDGTLLASAAFTTETSSGWQEVTFSAPVAIGAQTVYVASYHTASGRYSVTRNQFTSAGADAPPLHALSSSTSVNGVYRYGASGFPSASYADTNYWVDVVFATVP
jgi:hypothetical protein